MIDFLGVLTLAGVSAAWWELHKTSQISQSQFEDSLEQQYRELIKEIPFRILLGEQCPDDKREQVHELIYNYIDLCNEQIYLRHKGRIRKSSWKDWAKGMESHLQKSEFDAILQLILDNKETTHFNYLRRLYFIGFHRDPKYVKFDEKYIKPKNFGR